ncbi:hypothetical protein CRYUN_Cryun36dG0088500 [Craigia yunnanensis]
MEMEASLANERLHFGKMGYGCQHYRRRCNIRAPCCNEVFSCRHCHNEAASMLSNPFDRHELVRQDVKQVICSVCDTEQPVAQLCSNCGVNMGEYFCEICKFFDDDTEKGQFHCHDCGICRVGGRENFFHCKKCGSCYSIALRDNHLCVENSMRHHCPICYEYLFDSLKDTTVMKCGHTMHGECYYEMIKRDKYCCPICSKSVIDMSRTWKRIDEEIEATVMPEDYRYKKVWILCNDCNDTTEVYFHIIGQKCSHCYSFSHFGAKKKTVNGSLGLMQTLSIPHLKGILLLCYETMEVSLRMLLETRGEGRVLVLDGEEAQDVLWFEGIWQSAHNMGWVGIVVNGCIRDVDEINACDIGVQVLGSNPLKSNKKVVGDKHVPVRMVGTLIHDGEWLYADNDGILISKMELSI